jgi:cytidylate kinase
VTHVTVITIDGPVGVGKSTAARLVGAQLGYFHIDTGAMYRAVTLAAMEQQVNLADEEGLTRLAESLKIDLKYEDGQLRVYCNSRDVTVAIRQPEVSRNTSPVADVIGVRQCLVEQQRRLGLAQPSVCEGRDMGTVVFPDARWKFYLDASLEERTKRHAQQLRELGNHVDLGELARAIRVRDERDRMRPYGPLRIASDAVIIDTTDIGQDEVARIIRAFVGT